MRRNEFSPINGESINIAGLRVCFPWDKSRYNWILILEVNRSLSGKPHLLTIWENTDFFRVHSVLSLNSRGNISFLLHSSLPDSFMCSWFSVVDRKPWDELFPKCTPQPGLDASVLISTFGFPWDIGLKAWSTLLIHHVSSKSAFGEREDRASKLPLLDSRARFF